MRQPGLLCSTAQPITANTAQQSPDPPTMSAKNASVLGSLRTARQQNRKHHQNSNRADVDKDLRESCKLRVKLKE